MTGADTYDHRQAMEECDDSNDTQPAADGQTLTAEQMNRWASLLAQGSETIPSGLPPEQVEELIVRVRRLRHERMVRHIARQIARDIDQNRRASL